MVSTFVGLFFCKAVVDLVCNSILVVMYFKFVSWTRFSRCSILGKIADYRKIRGDKSSITLFYEEEIDEKTN